MHRPWRWKSTFIFADQGAEAPTREQRRRPGSRGARVKRREGEASPNGRPGSRGARVRGWREDIQGAEARGQEECETTTTAKWRRDNEDDDDGGSEA
ncbi:hypothetical protein Syun_016933 [Stephania yunnanensis]|uniref:Uncharacterized protein n=1 Tax=Stephania yunnanensis TaxID=152371 RepID=A0AAP0J5Y1_9MAGN